MGCFYFSIPLIGGYHVMQWAISKSHESIGERGEKLKVKRLQGYGDKIPSEDGKTQKVGAGGLGGGVHLAVSDEDDQKRSKVMLERFFRQERKKRRLKEKGKETENDAA
eukprot:CAMPEP_0172496976 /NCGR_PEP_ID=MMETSP1066-20121228/94725_1 /TAXON_ID=671091 /ORGANISM="Coscinodiscus wailesii, Strain CCMP2513" /LENGTH=108 /DNA_ID=CAMNT_0013269543 /DNA_START=141 /DNA_END=467 /DNA_ORIENTATION=-